jgi:hypothetical protein
VEPVQKQGTAAEFLVSLQSHQIQQYQGFFVERHEMRLLHSPSSGLQRLLKIWLNKKVLPKKTALSTGRSRVRGKVASASKCAHLQPSENKAGQRHQEKDLLVCLANHGGGK